MLQAQEEMCRRQQHQFCFCPLCASRSAPCEASRAIHAYLIQLYYLVLMIHEPLLGAWWFINDTIFCFKELLLCCLLLFTASSLNL